MADAIIIATWVFVAVTFVLAIVATHRFPHDGKKPLYHLYYAGVALFLAFLLPTKSQNILFSGFGVVLYGAAIPIYESVRAVCTPGTDDDTSWLQYWVAMGAIFFVGSYLDDYCLAGEAVQFHFHQVEVFLFVWLWLPFTNGSTLLFDYVTGPLLTPIIKPMSEKMGGWLNAIVMTFINAAHLWLVWIFFLFLPTVLKRFMVTAVGSVYPLLASFVAITTADGDDDTFWLTYWSCYGTLYVVVDYLERWLGKVPGFYTGILFTTVYLMLPMFQGAERFFRHVLVPCVGLKEMLLLRDAIDVRNEMMKSLPPGRQSEIRKTIANYFAEDGVTEVNKREIRKSWAWGGSMRTRYGAVSQDANV